MVEVIAYSKVFKLNKKQKQQFKTKARYKKAAEDISFTAIEGQIFGLLGPNGAGKTTTLRAMATLIKPTSGSIKIQGYDVEKESKKVRQNIGFLTNELKLDKHFTPKYTFEYFAKLHSMKPQDIEARRIDLFHRFGITEYENKQISDLSTGMTQKLSIAVSLAHDPEVIIFDEPTNGLDIITAKVVTDYLLELKEEGKLIIISTHIMSVVEKLCDRLAIIISGRKVAEGTICEILEKSETLTLEEAFFKIYNENISEEVV